MRQNRLSTYSVASGSGAFSGVGGRACPALPDPPSSLGFFFVEIWMVFRKTEYSGRNFLV